MARNRRVPRDAAGNAPAVAAAFDEMRFGRENTLDLRTTLPTGFEATQRAEAFLRERQMARVREVLLITGRGNQSPDGMPVVRPAVAGTLARLRRCGVVESWQEHSPGSFVVTPAPIKALLEAPRRHGDQAVAAVTEDDAFAGLADATRRSLRRLAIRSLQELGAPVDEPFVHDEMQRQFSALGNSIPHGADRDARLRAAAEATMDELDGAE